MRAFGLLAITLLFILPAIAATAAGPAADARQQHREAARDYHAALEPGYYLKGTISRSGAEGSFEGWHYEHRNLVHQTFGDLVWSDYSFGGSIWTTANFTLPYEVEPEDVPYSRSIHLLNTGRYLEDEFWPYFEFVGEDAAGYNFIFAPPDLPPVEVAVKNDPPDPGHLLIMKLEFRRAEHDPECYSRRIYQHYAQDPAGPVYVERETGREFDASGETVSFIEYTIDTLEWLESEPEDLKFDTTRQPIFAGTAAMDSAVSIHLGNEQGILYVPVTFAGSERTFMFMLDTGATQTLMTPDAAAASGFRASMVMPSHGHGSRADFELGLCTTASLGESGAETTAPLGGFAATRLEEGSELVAMLESVGFDGIMGIAPLHQYVTIFNTVDRQLTLVPPHLFDPALIMNERTLVFDLDAEDLVYIPAELNGWLTGELMIDSGIQEKFALLEETLDYHGVFAEVIGSQEHMVVGGRRDFEYVEIESLKLLPSEAPPGVPDIVITNGRGYVSEDDLGALSARQLLGFFGSGFFMDARLTFDLFNQKLYVELPAPPPSFPSIDDGLRPE